jgi:hypothetical protein
MEESKKELPDELTIALRKPLKHGDVDIHELNLREPNAGEFEKFAQKATTAPASALLGLLASVANIPPPIIAKLGVRDMNAAGEYLMGFMNRPTTDTKS